MLRIDHLSKLEQLRLRAYAKAMLPMAMERDKQKALGGLFHFVKHFWPILETKTPLVPGWPLQAVCDHLEAVTRGEIRLLLMNVPPGFMKALDGDVPILTTWGWKRHGDLMPGDFVFGLDGKPKRVIAVTEEKLEQSYDVVFDDGSSIVAGAGHQWKIERDVACVAPRYNRGRKRLVVSTTELRKSGYKHGKVDLRPDRIPLAAPVDLPPRRLLIDPYTLGAWLGDGNSTGATIYAAEEYAEHFCKLGRISHILEPSGSRKQRFYHIIQDGLQKKLRILGLLGNKHIPVDYLEASIEQRWELLRGLMDTDGHCTKTGNCIFSAKGEALARQVQSLCQSLAIKATVTSHEAKIGAVSYGMHFTVCFTPKVGARIFNLESKQKRCRGAMNGRSAHRYVADVKPIGDRKVKCIQVEGEIYLAGTALIPTHNSMLLNVFWPAWEWGPQNLSHLRYVAFSYASSLTERDNGRFRDLLISQEYQSMWGHVFKLREIGKIRVSNNKGGWKLASSVGGVGTGERGDRVLLDDPHNVKESESDVVRGETVRWFQESMSNRLNDIQKSAIIVIMQRVHDADVSGTILDEELGYCHLMIPMEFDARVPRIPTDIGWIDPREYDGKLAWPERFPDASLEQFRKRPFMWAGQYQQNPTPRGGSIISRDFWQVWPDENYPQCEFVLASLDSGYTEKEINDPSALTIWGIFRDKNGNPKALLAYAWEGFLEFNALVRVIGTICSVEKLPRDKLENILTLINRGTIQATEVPRFQVDKLIIENKANGISVAQELSRLYRQSGNFGIELFDPTQFGDKTARVIACEPIFADEIVYAPELDFADMVINQVTSYPKSPRRDLTDSTSQALLYLRRTGLLLRREEHNRVTTDEAMWRSRERPLY